MMGTRHHSRFPIDFKRFVLPLERRLAPEPQRTLERLYGITQHRQRVAEGRQRAVLAQWQRTVHDS
jgi:hypothetical protein